MEILLVKKDIKNMAELVLLMYKNTYNAFIEHNRNFIKETLDLEDKVNDLEKKIIKDLVDLSNSGIDLRIINAYTKVVGDLELIGDYCKDILERVEIKIEEKLLFSKEAVEDYNSLYEKVKEVLLNAVDLIREEKLKEDFNNLNLELDLEKIKENHQKRLLNGICSPLASNMFLNMVDYTFRIYEYAKEIILALKSV